MKKVAVVLFLVAMVSGPLFYPEYYRGGVFLLLQKPTLWLKFIAVLLWIAGDIMEKAKAKAKAKANVLEKSAKL